MATATVTEFKTMGDARDGTPQIAQHPPLTTQSAVTYTTSAQSAAFAGKCTLIRIATKEGAHYKVGANPTATANDPWLGPNGIEYIGVSGGQKVAFYDGTS